MASEGRRHITYFIMVESHAVGQVLVLPVMIEQRSEKSCPLERLQPHQPNGGIDERHLHDSVVWEMLQVLQPRIGSEAPFQLVARAIPMDRRDDAIVGMTLHHFHHFSQSVGLQPRILVDEQHRIVAIFHGMVHADVVRLSKSQVGMVVHHRHVRVIAAHMFHRLVIRPVVEHHDVHGICGRLQTGQAFVHPWHEMIGYDDGQHLHGCCPSVSMEAVIVSICPFNSFLTPF